MSRLLARNLGFSSIFKRQKSTLIQSLSDSYGRQHNYLRISLTERCNLRCRYCMPDEGVVLTPKERCLDLDELKRLTDLFVKVCGFTKVRLTGGEPTVDKKLVPLLEHLNRLRHHGLQTIAMTTNGLTLYKKASLYKSLGLNAINISLDTLRKDRFEKLTRRQGWHLVRSGIDTAVECQFDAVKVNCVVMNDVNDDEILPFVDLACQLPVEVRFIEYMPFEGNRWEAYKLMTYESMLKTIRSAYPDLRRLESGPNDVSKVYKSKLMRGTIGFITSMSNNFCSGCNRLRITADGNLRICLFGRDETSLRDLIRNGATDGEIIKAVSLSLGRKFLKNSGPNILKKETFRPMIKIGHRWMHIGCNTPDEPKLSHIDDNDEARMVNVGSKRVLKRVAVAKGKIFIGNKVWSLIEKSEMTKGDVITVSRLAGIVGAKWTSLLIPLCHQISLNHVQVTIDNQTDGWLTVRGEVEAYHKTGVEMEALTAVSITLLTIYDMCKSVNKSMVISDIQVTSKTKEAFSQEP